MGKKLEAARKEMAFARKSLEQMRSADDLGAFDNHWKDLLGRLTRLWFKTQASLKGDPRFTNSPHVKRVNVDLKKDPLIQYLARARDADEHTTAEITGQIEAGMQYEFELPDGNRIMMRNPQITIGDGPAMPMKTVGAAREYFAPAEVFANEVTTRDVKYSVPTMHDGKALPDTKLVTFAQLGLEYYERFLDAMEADGWDR
ncbi:hypothetical protein WQE_18174 [Paraburkholderia hospita]|uniref:Uncharacterized protein n=1 Tax=Paraburkholderia hospita TaxID=169430 RepID=A0ABP2PPW1_9BURK|nr:hypothetical protein [Paraburkholderia hospita]EIM99589.1 hypothetical protein WQE_18174 [Paraburkholderia hospita]OUL72631.1 hypothetical protein CA602_42870 [Paraburkholderia hospita]